ncbi:protein serine/threonine kinase [Aureococcus anophagefferens]|uniref:non-specific serine/threonine protein kinase n=1 Tax=Aureococcus anophagefferens TaxID=44056 RepID=A0ABR1FJ70_AURAN
MVGMSWMMADGADARSGQRATSLKDYVILEELFRSATGAVYKVRRKRDRRIFVLKERRVAELGRARRRPTRRSCWRRSTIRTSSRATAIFTTDRRASYVVLDYAAGGDLHALLKRRTLGDRAFFLPEAWIWRAFAQICGGLEHLHAGGRRPPRHQGAQRARLADDEGGLGRAPGAAGSGAPPAEPNLKLADLGVSRQVSENTQFLRTMYGTPLYASPELCEGRPYNEKTDIWSDRMSARAGGASGPEAAAAVRAAGLPGRAGRRRPAPARAERAGGAAGRRAPRGARARAARRGASGRRVARAAARAAGAARAVAAGVALVRRAAARRRRRVAPARRRARRVARGTTAQAHAGGERPASQPAPYAHKGAPAWRVDQPPTEAEHARSNARLARLRARGARRVRAAAAAVAA